MTGDCSLRKKKKIEEEKQCSGILGFGVLSLRQLCSRQKEIFHGAENMSSTLDSEGEGEGGMIWENGIETCILSCKK